MGKFKDKHPKEEENKPKAERIPESTINYYRRVSETLTENFESNEERGAF